MMQRVLANLSFVELRDRLQARAEALGDHEELDLMEALCYLTALPDPAHTPDSIDALFHLSRNFYIASRPSETIQAASRASQLATAPEHRHLLCKARGMEGIALCDLGRFAEAAAAYADFWTSARALGDVQREILAIKNVGGLCAAMAQWEAALLYLRRSRQLAAEHGYDHLEFGSRVNIANCHLQLGDPLAGLRALLPLPVSSPTMKREAATQASAHITLGHLYLSIGDVDAARTHAREAGLWAKHGGARRTEQLHRALLGLIEVKAGAFETGLAKLEQGLAFARRVDHMDVADYLSMCVDACDAAGQSDKALGYLQELVTWKQKLADAGIPQYEGLTEPLESLTSASVFDDNLKVRAHLLQADVGRRVRRYVETAINAEMANGYDIYRTVRVANLARLFAGALGWDHRRLQSLALGAQLSNIGMVAIPTQLLRKQRGLSDTERDIVRVHAQYGAELLRKSKLQILEVAIEIAEQHHERYDGSGYPLGLSGEAITEEARIVAICDAFDAMTHPRPWRLEPLTVDAALGELQQDAGHQFDPRLVNPFIELIERESSGHQHFDAFLAEGADEVEYIRVRARMDALITD